MDAAALRLADLESRRICRFCLRTCPADGGDGGGGGGGLTDIGSDAEVVSRIEFALSLEIAAQDGLPQRICDGCEWLLEKFHLFKNQCVKAAMLLKTFTESGVPLMQYFEPVKFEEFRWKRKEWQGVEVGVQAVEEIKPEPVYEMVSPIVVKQEMEEEWSYAEEPAVELNVDHADRVTMDELARRFYEGDGAFKPFVEKDSAYNVADLVTEMEIGSPQVGAPNVETFDDNSNDTVEFAPLGQTSAPTEEPPEPPKPVESLPDAMLLLMEDADQSQESKASIVHDSPQSPSDVIYDGLQTTPLRKSDGLPTRFVDMEPGEIVSDDEYDNSSVVVISSDTEDTGSLPEKPQPIVIPPTRTDVDFRCAKCDRTFPQAQLLEAHHKAYHHQHHHHHHHSKTTTTTTRKKITIKTPSALQKMAIMIDNPTQRCPKCGTMVHKASYWAHMRSHSAAERALVNYEKDRDPVAATAEAAATAAEEQNCVLEDDFLWDDKR